MERILKTRLLCQFSHSIIASENHRHNLEINNLIFPNLKLYDDYFIVRSHEMLIMISLGSLVCLSKLLDFGFIVVGDHNRNGHTKHSRCIVSLPNTN